MVNCNQDELIKGCPCSYTTCSRKGKCCECVSYHLKSNELPGCAFAKFSKDAERSYDRSFPYFAKLVLGK